MTRKIPKEVQALGGRFIPWTESITIRPPEGPPKGLRLSQPCGACCILDYFLDRPSVVNDGVNSSGHMLADLFIQTLLMPNTEVEVEKEYVWSDNPVGISGMDAVVDIVGDGRSHGNNRNPMRDLTYTGHYEFKTTSESNPKPKLGNREQVIRQRVVMARHYGITDAELFNSYIFLIQKSGNRSNWVNKPFLIEPTDAELKVAQRDIDLRVQVAEDILEDGLQEDPLQHPLMQELRRGTCTRCFPLQKKEASQEVLDIFTGKRDDWDRWIRHEKDSKWIKEIKESLKPVVPLGEQVETPYFLIRHTESGRLYVDAKNLK